LGISVPLLALSGGSRNQPLLRVAHSARRLTAGEGAPALAPLRQATGRHLPVLTATIGADAAGIAVPRSFLGLSTEYWGLPRYERNMRLFERILAAIHVRGDGPLILRVGGGSADHSYWEPIERAMPNTAFELTQSWLERTRSLVRSAGLRLILDLNLVSNSTAMAEQWADMTVEDQNRTMLRFGASAIVTRSKSPVEDRVLLTFTTDDYRKAATSDDFQPDVVVEAEVAA
jgi:hypothetical protein